jgi:hypothetical protein
MCCALMMIGTGALCRDSFAAVTAKSPSYALSLRATGSITANPNPIQVCDGTGLGITTLTWASTGTSVVEVHVDEPSGILLASTGPSGTVTTGKWVGNATQFFLQDVSGGLPLNSANTLATVTVYLTGCSSPGDQWATSGSNINNTNTGKVGIGNANPIFKLDVNGEINATGVLINGAPISSGPVSSVFGRTGAIVQQNNDYTWAQINKTSSSLADLQTRSAGDLNAGTVPIGRLGASGIPDATTFLRGDNTWATVSGSPSTWATSGTNVYYNSGNVGVGTTNPLWGLDVQKMIGNTVARFGPDVGKGALYMIADDPLIGFNTYFNNGFFYGASNGASYIDGALGNLTFATAPSGTAGTPATLTPRMIILQNGNVGIGTMAPNRKLELAGDVGGLSFEAASGSPNSGAIRFGDNTGWKFHFGRSRDSVGGALNSGTAGVLMTIQDNGNVGVGTTSPSYRLDVQGGTVNASGGLCIAGVCKANWSEVGLSQWTTSGTSVYYNTGNVGIGTSSPGASLDIAGNPASAIRTSYLNISASNGVAGDRPYIRGTNTALVINGYGTGTGGTLYLNYPGDLAAGQTTSTRVQETLFVSATGSDGAGNVGIGTQSPAAKLDVQGDINVSGNINAKYQDVAEWVSSTQKLAAGTVVTLDPSRPNHVLASTSSYDTAVAGVISARPGIALGEAGEGKALVATTGRVKVRVDATRGPIHIGDLLVTSDVEGMAMKSEPVTLGGRRMHSPGTIIGKALETLESGTGEILVLLSLQ